MRKRKDVPELLQLRTVSEDLARQEEVTRRLRARRDMLIYRACEAGATERAAADAGHVSAAYAHRCKADEGRPRSGPALDAAGARTSRATR